MTINRGLRENEGRTWGNNTAEWRWRPTLWISEQLIFVNELPFVFCGPKRCEQDYGCNWWLVKCPKMRCGCLERWFVHWHLSSPNPSCVILSRSCEWTQTLNEKLGQVTTYIPVILAFPGILSWWPLDTIEKFKGGNMIEGLECLCVCLSV